MKIGKGTEIREQRPWSYPQLAVLQALSQMSFASKAGGQLRAQAQVQFW